MKNPFSKPTVGKISVLDWVEVRELAQKGQMKDSVVLLLKRAYNLTEEEIENLPKDKVNRMLANIEGIRDGFVCSNCGGPLGKLLCEKCVTFEGNRKQIADELMQEASRVVGNK